MTITDETNTTFAPGVPLAVRLRNELTAFAAPTNPAGTALLTPLLANAAVTVTIKNTGATATKGTKVTVNTSQTGGTGNEFVESVIFELTNASNDAAFTALENSLKLGGQAVRAYGRAKADIEAEASWNLAQILTARVGYVPSTFGAKTIVACNHPSLAAFQTVFRALPHDSAAAATSVMSLPSQEMYAFNGAVIVAATRSTLNSALNIMDPRKTPAARIFPEKLKGALATADISTICTQQPQKAARFYWTLVEALRVPGVTVNWGGGGIANWEFTPAMRAVAPDSPTPWQTRIAAWLAAKNAAMYVA